MRFWTLVMPLCLLGCEVSPQALPEARPQPGTQAWFERVESRVRVLDADGHGPDLGSVEWSQAVESRLGIGDGQGNGLDPGSDAWNQAVDARLFGD